MEKIETITPEECVKRLKKDPVFIRNAIELIQVLIEILSKQKSRRGNVDD